MTTAMWAFAIYLALATVVSALVLYRPRLICCNARSLLGRIGRRVWEWL